MNFEHNPTTRPLVRRLLKLEDKLKGIAFPGLKRVKQITIYHCGPAVLESLFSFLGVKVSQRQLVRSLRIQKKIVLYGMSVKELSRAVKIAGRGRFSFWEKHNATLGDLDKVINDYKYPVGVEWQGIFYEFEDEDNGHYGIITNLDKKRGFMRLSDPFHAFAGVDRKLNIRNFLRRWWDENEIVVSGQAKRRKTRDNKVMFVITPKADSWPKKLGMRKS